METFEKPEPCRSLGCVVEVVPADATPGSAQSGGGYWIQHACESKNVVTLEEGAAWLAHIGHSGHPVVIGGGFTTVTTGGTNDAAD